VIGRITRAHGLRGEVKVRPETDFPDRFARLRRVLLLPEGTEPREVTVEAVRRQGTLVLLKLTGVDDPEAARALRGAAVAVAWEERVPLPEGQYYVAEVLGLAVRTEEGEPLGTVAEVLRTLAHDVYRIVGDGGELLIPATRDVVRALDLTRREVVVRLPAGLRQR
jgi:16S rRNA processing protein RimM